MAYFVTITSPRGETLDLMNSDGYQVTRVNGMDPPKANVNVDGNATSDGGTFNSAKIGTRNIVINLTVNDPAEQNRIALYRFIKLKRKHVLNISNGSRSVRTEGYAESIAVAYFDKRETVQISFICPDPAFYAENDTTNDFATVQALFEFPFSIPSEGIPFSERNGENEIVVTNNGEFIAGVIIKLKATGSASNPVILNRTTGDTMALTVSMDEGDEITIDTRRGHKAITRLRNGVSTNLINSLTYSSDWLTLESGDNEIYFTATNPQNIRATITHSDQYEGI